MLKTESHFLFQIPDKSEKRVLHRAKVVSVEGTLYTAELEEEGPVLEDRMDFFIYFEMDRKFMRQTARVKSVTETESNTLFEFETFGEPFSAENRQALRISSVGADLSATFGSEENCEVVDVSPTGFAVYGKKKYEIGSHVEATLNFQGEAFKGMVTIMTAIERKGAIRYGVHCIDDPKIGSSLKNGLGRITMAIQRQQLARISRHG
jgi:hypothetical protein